MQSATIQKTTAILLAFCCFITGCSKQQASPSSPSSGVTGPDGAYRPQLPEVSKEMAAAREKNADVVGWLTLPNMQVNEAVVQTTNNDYYLRRDVKGNYAYEGCYYMDYESVMFDEGADLAQNTIVYGHNLGSPLGVKDDPNGVKFAQLLKLEDEELARNTPYIFLATPAKTHTFEIFAAFYCEERLTPVPYHLASYTGDRLTQLAADVKTRSSFLYDVEVKESDKLITLSTCTYKYGTYSQNSRQRYVVMGRLVQEGETYREKAVLKKNPNPKPPQF